MKRTFKSLLAAAGLAFIGLGSLLTATPAQAAYVPPHVPTGYGCSLYTKSGFPYPYTPGAGQFVYCGNGATKYKEQYGGDTIMNLPFQTGTSMLRQKFQAANVTLYIFKNPTDAQAALNLPTSVLANGILGITVTAVTSPATTPIMVVWENYKDPATGALTAVPTTPSGPTPQTKNMFSGAVSHESGHVTDWLAGNFSRNQHFKDSFMQDQNGFNARSTCFLFPYPTPSSSNPVCNSSGVVQPNWVGKTNKEIMLTISPGYTRYFSLDSFGGYSETFAEQVPLSRFGTAGGIDGKMDGYIDLWGTYISGTGVQSCTRKYTEQIYKFWNFSQPSGCP